MEAKTEFKKEEKESRETTDRNGHHTKRRYDKPKRRFDNRVDNTGTFKGQHKELAGYIYTYDSATRASQYEKTTERIADWLKSELGFPMDIWRCVANLKEPNIYTWIPKTPTVPDNTDDTLIKALFNEEVKEYMMRKRTYNNNKSKAYTVILGQCTEALKAKMKGQDNWDNIHDEHDVVMLLKSIKTWMLNQQDARSPTLATYNSITSMFKIQQYRHETLVEFRTRFVTAIQVIEHIGVDFGRCLTRLTNMNLKDENVARDQATKEQINAAEQKTFERMQAVAFLLAADKARYGAVLTHLENQHLTGIDQYPENVTVAYNMLMNWRSSANTSNDTPYNDGITFAQDCSTNETSKKTPRDRSGDRCRRCGEIGHHAWERKCKDHINKQMMHAMTSQGDHKTDNDQQKEADSTSGEQDERYEYAFCTTGQKSENTDMGLLLSQEGSVKDKIQTNSFNARRAHVIPDGSVGLDSMSSVDVFGDGRLLTNVHTVLDKMRIVCNAGTVVVTQMGTFRGYGKVWYHPDAIANILSLSNVQTKFRVTYDSKSGNHFVVHRDDGSQRLFSPTTKGLYVSQINDHRSEVTMINTVKENVKAYTRREVKQAESARRLMEIIGRPSEQQMCAIVNGRQLKNCDVGAQDIINARKIFGPDVASLKGKTVRQKEAHVEMAITPIPQDVMERHREVIVCFDVMYINSIAFLVSISRGLKFCTTEALENRRSTTLLTSLRRIKTTYSRRGFIVNQVAGDNEFNALEVGLSEMGIILNTVARDEHVPEVERHIRTLKERCRATYNALPFRRLPSRMIIELVYCMTFWIHAFPAVDGVSATISPRELVTGIAIDASKHCRLPFGSYVQTHEQHDNSMSSRTIGAITLRPTGNRQGGYYFFSLQTGRRIIRNKWTEIPMPADVIQRVHAMAESRMLSELVFADRENTEIQEDDPNDEGDNEDYTSDSETMSGASSTDEDEHAEDGGEPPNSTPQPNRNAETRRVTLTDMMRGEDQNHQDERVDDVVVKEEIQAEDGAQRTQLENNVHTEASEARNDDHANSQNCEGNTNSGEVTLDEQMDNKYGTRSGAHNLRARRKPRYDLSLLAQDSEHTVAPRFNTAHLADIHPSLEPLLGVIITQYGIRKGLKVFGSAGDDAVRKEMEQLHNRDVMRPLSGQALTASDRQSALRYLMFLKQKRDGTIKGRGCADGRKQRGTMEKSEASSPTISTEAVFLIITIAAKEHRDVATVDIPGAFMQTELSGEQVVIKIEGRMVELLAMIDPKLYRKYIMVEKGRPVLYAELCKVLYGMLQAALKFWEQISSDLISLGYEINPYDWCVANKIIDGEQHTVGWHVDDFILTHKNSKVNDQLIDWLSNKYGNLAPLTVHRGGVHEYLGMNLDFTKAGKVTVKMSDYITRLLDDAPVEFAGRASTPAGKHLFTVDEKSAPLDEDQANMFHHLVAKILFLSKRARPDVQLAVGFLCTRVKAPDNDDWKKLRRLIQYLRNTKELTLTLEAGESRVIKWWIDAAFAVHADYRSQSGGAMTLGKGMAYSGSVRQKLNTKSSTEAELVGTNDFMPQILWTRYFLQEQGYGVKDNIVHQDNQSSILLEENGRGSSSKRTRHINIRFFFITDRINSDELSVRYCPTDDMVGDFFTKPLQGTKFRKFRDIVLNINR